MKALLLKDFYVLWKQMKAFLVLILLFSALPGSYNAIFAVTYAAMLPYSCVAYDERSKWDQLAAMMPYSNRDLVLSRYILGWIAGAGACLLSLLLQEGFALILHQAVYPDTLIASFFVCPVHSGHHAAADLPLRRGAGPAHHVPDHLPGVRLCRRLERHCRQPFRHSAGSGVAHCPALSGADRSLHSPVPAVVHPAQAVRRRGHGIPFSPAHAGGSHRPAGTAGGSAAAAKPPGIVSAVPAT